MPDAPTTEGSIVAYLRLNTSDWDEKLDAAQAKARELGRVDPNIRVNADVAEAMAKIEAVRAAEAGLNGGGASSGSTAKTDTVVAAQRRLETAERSAANAASAQYLAELRLADVQDKRGRTDYQLAAAEEAVARATRNAEAAESRYIVANQALKDSQTVAARAALDQAAAEDVNTAAMDRGNQAGGAAINRTGLIAAGIAALIPLSGAAAGATVALGGAFVGMGAAGFLAFRGISEQMDHNTLLGLQYKAGVDQLTGSLDKLSATAALRMLGSFEEAVATINLAMPQLNSQVSVFTGYAGRIGNDALSGAINALRVLNPLFVQAGDYVEHLSAGFLHWTEDGGLQKFAAFATGEFPQVVATLDSLGQAVIHVGAAFAPWGGTMLTGIKAVGDVINAIPTGILPEVAIGATAAYLAFSKWSTIKAGISGVGDSLQQVNASAKGAFGAILQVTAAVDTMVLQATAAASDGIKQWQGYTQGTDKWAASIRAGNINVHDLGTTLQRTGGFWNDFGNNMDVAGTAYRPFYDNVKALDQAMASSTPADLKRAYAQLVAEGTKVGKSQADIAALFPEATAAIHAQRQAAGDATAAQSQNVDVVDKLAAATKTAKTALQQYSQALQGLGKTSLDETAANVAYQQSIADATTALQANGVTLDVNTQKGRDNTTALDGIASSAIALISAHQAAGESTNQLTGDMAAARASFIQTAEKMGATADEANHLADQYGLVPTNITTAFNTAGVGQAEADAAALQASYDAITRLITVRVNTINTNATNPNVGFGLGNGHSTGGAIYRAAGGAVDMSYLAAGGSPFVRQGTDTVPAMLTPGEFVTKAASAKYDPPFMKAYNDNPRAALDAVRGQGAVPINIIIQSKDGIDLSKLIDVRVERGVHRALTQMAVQIQGGVII